MTNIANNITEKGGTLLYSYKRGSLAQGTFIEGKSDIDTCSVYLAPISDIIGLGLNYKEEISDKSHDNVGWEFAKFMRLLLKSNPTVLEALFVDDEFVDYEHPLITELKKHRDLFVTKECFKPFGAYAHSQIEKCRSLNKNFLKEDERYVERREALSFCYTYHNQGSTKMQNWLAYRGLLQECCGLNKIPNMRDDYGVFYDWGKHWRLVGYNPYDALEYYLTHAGEDEALRDDMKYCVGRYIEKTYYDALSHDGEEIFDEIILRNEIGYRGIFKNSESTEVRLSSIQDKDDKPICHMSFNEDGFKKHCREYKDFVEWKEKRNPVRYAQNKGKNYDAKNVSHSFRLMNMCIEIAKGEGFKVNRRGIDSEFLLDVKHHKFEYEEIMAMLEDKKKLMDEAIANSTITDTINVDFVNDFVVKVRKEQLKIK